MIVVAGTESQDDGRRISDAQLNALRTLEAVTLAGPVGATIWLKSTNPSIPERSFYRIQARLIELNLVERTGRSYSLTPWGRAKLTVLPAATGVLPATHSTSVVAVADMSPEALAVPWQSNGSGSNEDPDEETRFALREGA